MPASKGLTAPAPRGWRAWRPAIWLAMLGVAALLVMSAPYLGILILGAAIGVAARIAQRQRRGTAQAAAGSSAKSTTPARRRKR